MACQARIGEVTARIAARSRATRAAYLERIDKAVSAAPARKKLGDRKSTRLNSSHSS